MTRLPMTSSVLRAAAAAGMTALALVVPAMASDTALPKAAKPLSAVELVQLYAGKTWQWSTGGGYFARDARTFLAHTADETSGTSTAKGRWSVTNSGKLCFSANWVNVAGSAPAITCFQHKWAGKAIYQRRLPDGQWYVFKHAKADPADEYNKLIRKDLVSQAL